MIYKSVDLLKRESFRDAIRTVQLRTKVCVGWGNTGGEDAKVESYI